MKKKGFTLVELLVVIAIIGILATIVLVNLNAARNKAKDAAIKATLSEARVAAEMYYDDIAGGNGDYENFCTSADEGRIDDAIGSQGGTAYTCADNTGAWCAQATLPGAGTNWCVSMEGHSGAPTTACSAANIECD